MRTTIITDPELLEAAMKAGPYATTEAAVEAGLRLLVRPAPGRSILEREGKLRWEGDEGPAAPDWRGAATTVHQLWALFQARDWAGARALLHDDARMHWVTSGEHFDDADAIIRVNAIYPEGWSIHVISVDELAGGQVHSTVEVRHGAARFFGNSRFRLEAGRIREITEYWAGFEDPPAWRTPEALGAYRREPQEKNRP